MRKEEAGEKAVERDRRTLNARKIDHPSLTID
jgi:hypothetical protein